MLQRRSQYIRWEIPEMMSNIVEIMTIRSMEMEVGSVMYEELTLS